MTSSWGMTLCCFHIFCAVFKLKDVFIPRRLRLSLQHQSDNRSGEPGQNGAYGANTGWAGKPKTPDLHSGPADWPVRTCLQPCQGGTRKDEVGKWKLGTEDKLIMLGAAQELPYTLPHSRTVKIGHKWHLIILQQQTNKKKNVMHCIQLVVLLFIFSTFI